VYFDAIDEPRNGLILTPRCDIAQDRVEFLHVCPLLDAWEIVGEFISKEWTGAKLLAEDGSRLPGPLSKTKRDNFANSLKLVITQRLPRYHWLEPLPGSTIPQILDFQILLSILLDEVKDKPVVAELAGPFAEEVSARYAAFMGRVGTPDYSSTQIDQWTDEACAALFPTGSSTS
jgi:hypothetical protein